MSGANTIILRSNYSRKNQERDAEEAILPGHVIEVLSTGKVQKHSTASGAMVEKIFATEDALQGKTVDDAYAIDDKVFHAFPQPGDIVNALVQAGSNIAIGDSLVSAGDGTLVAVGTSTAATDAVAVAVCDEAQDLTATGAVATRTRVRIL